jgi:hypothetical protein
MANHGVHRPTQYAPMFHGHGGVSPSHTAFTQSSIVPVRRLAVIGDESGDDDEHPANTPMAKMAAKQGSLFN